MLHESPTDCASLVGKYFKNHHLVLGAFKTLVSLQKINLSHNRFQI